MARHNQLSVYGMLSEDPIIVRDESGNYKKGMARLILVRGNRDSGLDDDDALRYDQPIVFSGNPEMIQQMAQLKKYDLVEIKGFLSTLDISKKTTCKECGESNYIKGTLNFISPIFIDVRKTDNTEREGLIELRAHREVSNQILLVANLCTDVQYYHNGKIKSSRYQLAVNRKYYTNDGNPSIRTDYPFICSYGENAYKDYKALYTGSLVLVDGRIQTREFVRTTTCEHCGATYDWNDSTVEVISYSTEYLNNFNTPEDIEEQEQEELAAIKKDIFG